MIKSNNRRLRNSPPNQIVQQIELLYRLKIGVDKIIEQLQLHCGLVEKWKDLIQARDKQNLKFDEFSADYNQMKTKCTNLSTSDCVYNLIFNLFQLFGQCDVASFDAVDISTLENIAANDKDFSSSASSALPKEQNEEVCCMPDLDHVLVNYDNVNNADKELPKSLKRTTTDISDHENQRKKLKCDFANCSYVTDRTFDLRKHCYTHDDETRYICSFDNCDYVTNVLERMNKHNLSIHESQEKSSADSFPIQYDIDQDPELDQKPFRCNLGENCTFIAHTASNLIKHQSTSHNEPTPVSSANSPVKFHCNIEGCQYSTPLAPMLKCHRLFHTNELQRKFRCDFKGCWHTAKDANDLKKHKQIHNRRKYPSPVDGGLTVTKTRDSLPKHRAIQLRTLRHKCDIKGCAYLARTPGELLIHKQTHQSNRNTNNSNRFIKIQMKLPGSKLTASDVIVVSQSKKNQTQLQQEDGEPRFKCDYEGCRHVSLTSNNLNKHRLIHNMLQSFKCDLEGCSYATHSQDNLNKHKIHHNAEQKFKCDFEGCPYACTAEYDLDKHRLSHNPKTKLYKCEVPGCQYITHMQRNLRYHLNKNLHTSFYCSEPGCQYSSKQHCDFAKHIKLHLPRPKYQCNVAECNFGCDKSTDLDIHNLSHQPEPRFKYSYGKTGAIVINSDQNPTTNRNQSGVSTKPVLKRKFQCDVVGCFYSTNLLDYFNRHKQSEHRTPVKLEI